MKHNLIIKSNNFPDKGYSKHYQNSKYKPPSIYSNIDLFETPSQSLET